MKECTLVIDVDSDNVKATLVDTDGKEKNTSKKELVNISSEQSWIEVDANEIWISTMYVIIDLVKNFSVNPEYICEIGIRSRQETLVVWDEKTGIPMYHAVFERPVKEEEPSKEEHRIETETPQYVLKKKVNWILEHEEGAKEKAEKQELVFGTVDYWIAYRMTGEFIPKNMLPVEDKTYEIYGYTDPIHFFGMEIPVVKISEE